MIFKPRQLGAGSLPDNELVQDKKACRKFGPCGVGKKALYLNSFYIDRQYYIPIPSVTRVFKRVAMSKGGFTGKGIFASIPYLVVEYDNGKEKQCNFKYEQNVDLMLACLQKEHPELKFVSASVEKRLAEKEAERAARPVAVISNQAQKEAKRLELALDYLNRQPELAVNLSAAAKAKRVNERTNPAYKWTALAITLLGLAALAYGIWSFVHKSGYSFYFTLFGLAAIFLFSGANVLPTARNNKKAVAKRLEDARSQTASYIEKYPDFPVPARYAHPVVLLRMIRAIRDGKAETSEAALEAVKDELKALNSSVQVEQEEYDEVVAVKPLFLVADYQ